jgi:hypothetical protein
MNLRARLTPDKISAYGGYPIQTTVTVANSADLVDAFQIRVLGIDNEWVSCTPEKLQLFPQTTGDFELTLNLPPDFPSGKHLLTVQVRSELKADRPTLLLLTVEVDLRPRTNVQVQPTMLNGTTKGTFSVTVQNLGNGPVDARLSMDDPESLVTGIFDRQQIDIPAGEQRSTPLRVKAKRPWTGDPVMRTLTIGVEGGAPGSEQMITFVQPARISRLMFSFIGMLIAATVFGIVFSRNLKNVVDATKTDPKILEAAFGSSSNTSGIGGSILGTVRAQTSRNGVDGAIIELYSSSDETKILAQVASSSGTNIGRYSFNGLGKGPFRLRIRAAGYDTFWYGGSTEFKNAQDVTPSSGSVIDILLKGVPASVSGTIIGGVVKGATVDLLVPSQTSGSSQDALFGSIETDDTGNFEFLNVPAPGQYTVRIRKVGSTTSQIAINLDAGEARTGITMQLRSGDGFINGTVSGPDGPLGNATVSISSTDLQTSTLSLTSGTPGSFSIPDLLTPATYSIATSLANYTTETRTITLAAGQSISNLTIRLVPAIGSISGLVTDFSNTPIGLVPVSATDGEKVYTTTSLSTGSTGMFLLQSLPAPGVYTLTIGGGSFNAVTRNVVLSSTSLVANERISLIPSTGQLTGLVTDESNTGVGSVKITASAGTVSTTTYSVSSCPPAIAACKIGSYRFDGLTPGQYTITFARTGSEIVALPTVIGPGLNKAINQQLSQRASMTVYVCAVVANDGTCTSGPKYGYQVRLWKELEYPGGSPIASLITNASGQVQFSNLDAPLGYIIDVASVVGGPGVGSESSALSAGEALVVGVVAP